MSPERRERFETWHSAGRKPGSRAGRVRAKQEREAKELLQSLIEAKKKPVDAADPVDAELAAQLEAVRARRAALEAEFSDQIATEGEGVFG
jgi:hypothetical protein